MSAIVWTPEKLESWLNWQENAIVAIDSWLFCGILSEITRQFTSVILLKGALQLIFLALEVYFPSSDTEQMKMSF